MVVVVGFVIDVVVVVVSIVIAVVDVVVGNVVDVFVRHDPPFNSAIMSGNFFLINCMHEEKVPGTSEFKQSSFLFIASLLRVGKLLQSSGKTKPPSLSLQIANVFLFTHLM